MREGTISSFAPGETCLLVGPCGAGKTRWVEQRVLALSEEKRHRLEALQNQEWPPESWLEPDYQKTPGMPDMVMPAILVAQRTFRAARRTVLDVLHVREECATWLAHHCQLTCGKCQARTPTLTETDIVSRMRDANRNEMVAISGLVHEGGEPCAKAPPPHEERLERILRCGFSRWIIDGKVQQESHFDAETFSATGDWEVIIDRVAISDTERLLAAVQLAGELADGKVSIRPLVGTQLGERQVYYLGPRCPRCGTPSVSLDTRALLACLGLDSPPETTPIERCVVVPFDIPLAEFLSISLSELCVHLERIPSPPRFYHPLDYLRDMGLGRLSLTQSIDQLEYEEWILLAIAAEATAPQAGVIYLLDECLAPLHSKDRLTAIRMLRKLAEYGNLILCLEADDTLAHAFDKVHLLATDSPAPGPVVDPRTKSEAIQSLLIEIPVTEQRSGPSTRSISIPSSRLTCIVGTSLSDIRRLLSEVETHIRRIIDGAIASPHRFRRMVSLSDIRKSDSVRSTVGRFLGIDQRIAEIFGRQPLSLARGYTSLDFSRDSSGSCPSCQGVGGTEGKRCPSCQGSGFRRDVREVLVRGQPIDTWLEAPIASVLSEFSLFGVSPLLARAWQSLALAHLRLDALVTAQSDGVRQRLCLSRELPNRLPGLVIIATHLLAGLSPSQSRAALHFLKELSRDGVTLLSHESDLPIVDQADVRIDVSPSPDGDLILSNENSL